MAIWSALLAIGVALLCVARFASWLAAMANTIDYGRVASGSLNSNSGSRDDDELDVSDSGSDPPTTTT